MDQVHCIILGERNVGKTTLLYDFLNIREKGYIKTKPTVSIQFHQYVQNDTLYKIWDTSGEERYVSILESYIPQNNMFLLVHNINQIAPLEKVEFWLTKVCQHRDMQKTFVKVVGTFATEISNKSYKHTVEFFLEKWKDKVPLLSVSVYFLGFGGKDVFLYSNCVKKTNNVKHFVEKNAKPTTTTSSWCVLM